MIRKLLDGFYLGCALLSGISLMSMVLLVLLQILARFVNTHIPSSDDISGYMVAWTTFLGLAYAMKNNDHIRVDILFNVIAKKYHVILNTIAHGLGCLLLSIFLYYVFLLVKESYDFDDMTTGFLPLPLWMIQSPYLLGVFALWLAVLDRFLTGLITDFRKKN